MSTESAVRPATTPVTANSQAQARCEAALRRELADDSPRSPEVQQVIDALKEIAAFNDEVLGGRVFSDSVPILRKIRSYSD